MPRARRRRLLGLAVLAALLLAAAAPAAGAAPALSPAQVAALGGHLQPWQVAWLETGGASRLPGGRAAAPPDPASATYAIGGQDVTLHRGTASGPLTAGSLYVVRTSWTGPTASGDLAGDGIVDTATTLAQTGPHGGTATFLAVLPGAPTGGAAPTVLLGDNVAVSWLEVTVGEVLAETSPSGGGPAQVRAFRLRAGALRPAPAPRTAGAAWSPSGFRAVLTEAGSCAGASRVAGGAYRCTADGTRFDPCFALPGLRAVACPQGDPGAESGVRIDVGSALPATAPAAAAPPWAFTLRGGGSCRAPGGPPAFPTAPYTCSVPGLTAAAPRTLHCTAPTSAGFQIEAVSCAAAAGLPARLGPARPGVVARAWY